MNKPEFKDDLKSIYGISERKPYFVNVPAMGYLAFDGEGHPSGEDFQTACEALFTLSYLIKFDIARKTLGIDYKVSPMEATWFLDKNGAKTKFTWTMMIRQPDFVTEDTLAIAASLAKAKKKLIASERVRFSRVEFGKCVQCVHRGDYNEMNSTLAKMQAFADENGFDSDKYTHDIYLNDSRKTKTENLRAIMRLKIYER